MNLEKYQVIGSTGKWRVFRYGEVTARFSFIRETMEWIATTEETTIDQVVMNVRPIMDLAGDGREMMARESLPWRHPTAEVAALDAALQGGGYVDDVSSRVVEINFRDRGVAFNRSELLALAAAATDLAAAMNGVCNEP